MRLVHAAKQHRQHACDRYERPEFHVMSRTRVICTMGENFTPSLSCFLFNHARTRCPDASHNTLCAPGNRLLNERLSHIPPPKKASLKMAAATAADTISV
ncbi:MAG: hypothetical protein BWY59_01412 [Verrucomicrobia bacterium ADurb.Bin345]|nr:MAG: hypothetical protein BWY59_01412 [Verrucomicrobia bacterium ADurb.Bin345]